MIIISNNISGFQLIVNRFFSDVQLTKCRINLKYCPRPQPKKLYVNTKIIVAGIEYYNSFLRHDTIGLGNSILNLDAPSEN